MWYKKVEEHHNKTIQQLYLGQNCNGNPVNELSIQTGTFQGTWCCFWSPQLQRGVANLQNTWEACPLGCKPIVLGDLNNNFGFPQDEREEVIVDLLDEIILIDTSCRFPSNASTGNHQSTVDMESEAPRDPVLHAARLLYGSRRGYSTI